MGEHKCKCGGWCKGRGQRGGVGTEHKRVGQIGVTAQGRSELGLVSVPRREGAFSRSEARSSSSLGVENQARGEQISGQENAPGHAAGMPVWRGLREVPSGLSSVVTIGIFDGVHLGHQRILKTAGERAAQLGLPAVVLTFSPHPSRLHRPENPSLLISPLEDRLARFAAAGIGGCLVEDYTWELAALRPEEFVLAYFVRGLGARCVVVGRDVKFGVNNSGDLAALRALGAKHGFEVLVVDDEGAEAGQRYSSTSVRELLGTGDMAGVARVLGRPYRLRGVIERGEQRGRQIGFPTANLGSTEGLALPAQGVYAGWLVRAVAGQRAVEFLPAAISVGTNPQFDGQRVTVEAHVLGRSDLNLYGEEVALDFVAHLRPMLKFSALDDLLAQMDVDLRRTAEILNVPSSGRIPVGVVQAQPR